MANRDRGGGRIVELDAVRGFAAMSVVLWHLALALPAVSEASRSNGLTPWNLALYSPLRVFFAGTPAVIVFFVLSGFVLTVSYASGRQTYAGFLIRRIARIWIPYVAAVAIGVILAAALGSEFLPGSSEWVNARWHEGAAFGPVAEHVALIGPISDDGQYVPVIWSLTEEMRVSLIFPLLVASVLFLGWRRSLLGAVALCVVGVVLSTRVWSDFATLKYIVCFVAGALLALHRQRISSALSRTTTARRISMFVAAILLYTWFAWVPTSITPGRLHLVAHNDVLYVLLETVAACIFIALAQQPGRARELLRARVPQYLGRISYSLYLLHTLVLLAALHINDGRISVPLLYPAVLAVSIIASDVLQRIVERPAQHLGRVLARRVEAGHQGPPPLGTLRERSAR
jgi:peptidoglycan/LPS O-acetylase OafA/YrhL